MPRQADLAIEAGLHQSRISMFETPGMANMTLETLAKVAAGLKVGVIVKLVPFHEMLRWENSFSQDVFDVIPRLDQDEAFLNPRPAESESDLAEIAPVSNYIGEGERKPPQNVQEIKTEEMPPQDMAGAAASGGM